MAKAIVTQVGPRARIVGAEALLAGVAICDRAARGYVSISVVVVGIVAIVITVVIAIVVVTRKSYDVRSSCYRTSCQDGCSWQSSRRCPCRCSRQGRRLC